MGDHDAGSRPRLDPRTPYRLERGRGRGVWWATSVAAYALAWRLLLLPLASAAVVLLSDSAWEVVAWTAGPAAACTGVGAVCALADHFDDEPFGWWGPWTLFRSCGRAWGYAVGGGRS